MNKFYKITILLTVVVMLIFIVVSCVRPQVSPSTLPIGPAEATPPASGAGYVPIDRGFGQIGEFSTADMDGNTVTEDVLKEKPLTFIYYWATWCRACVVGISELNELYEKYKDDVTFITIIDDGSQNSAADNLIKQHLKNFVNLLPVEDLVGPIRTRYIPTSVIVDSGGFLIEDRIIGNNDFSVNIDAALEIVNAR